MPARSPRRRLYELEASPELATCLPRKARAGRWRAGPPGALHHVIGRGIDRGKILLDDTDRNNFLGRLGDIVTDTKIACYACPVE